MILSYSFSNFLSYQTFYSLHYSVLLGLWYCFTFLSLSITLEYLLFTACILKWYPSFKVRLRFHLDEGVIHSYLVFYSLFMWCIYFVLSIIAIFVSHISWVIYGEGWTLREVAGKLENCEKSEKWEMTLVGVSSSVWPLCDLIIWSSFAFEQIPCPSLERWLVFKADRAGFKIQTFLVLRPASSSLCVGTMWC